MAQIDSLAKREVLVTGATGFVGRVLCAGLEELGYSVRRSSRTAASPQSALPRHFITGELGEETDWSGALRGISIVFHLAARTHVIHETAKDALAEYRRVNVNGTRSLAQAAVRAGVGRIVFLSSIKVSGERTANTPFADATPPHPEDAYGISKWEAEQSLLSIAREAGLETVILRPPLVYGPGVRGNFLRLLHWIARGVPLPLAAIDNRRSLIFVENLADALIAAGRTPAAAGKTYLVSDGVDVSTPLLIRSIAEALQVRARLFPCPIALLTVAASSIGKQEEIRRLVGSLQIDSSGIRRELSWVPRFQLDQGLARTAQWYHSQFPAKSTT